MSHIALRELHEDDRDSIFEMMRDPQAVDLAAFTASDPDDRAAFDAWMDSLQTNSDAVPFVVTEDGAFVGTAALFTAEGKREVTYWIARTAWGRGVASEALRILIAHEAERPLFARVASHNVASLAVLARNGFTELSRNEDFAPGVGRTVEEIVMVLMPTLD